MKNNMKLALLAGVCAMALGFGASSAYALPSPSSQFFYGAKNQLSDNNAERLLDIVCDPILGTGCGIIDIGDILRGVIEWGTVENLTSGGPDRDFGGITTNEFTGIFEAQVLTKFFLGDPDGTLGNADDVYGFTFGPSTSGFQASFGANPGAIVIMFEDTNGNESNIRGGPTIPGNEANATDTIKVWEWGFDLITPDLDEQWTAVGPQGPSAVTASGAGETVFNYQLSSLFNAYGLNLVPVATGCSGVAFTVFNNNPCLAPIPPIGGDSLIDINGSGSVLPAGLPPWPVWSNSDAVFQLEPIPEPGSLLLFGTGLLGLAALRRRRTRA